MYYPCRQMIEELEKKIHMTTTWCGLPAACRQQCHRGGGTVDSRECEAFQRLAFTRLEWIEGDHIAALRPSCIDVS